VSHLEGLVGRIVAGADGPERHEEVPDHRQGHHGVVGQGVHGLFLVGPLEPRDAEEEGREEGDAGVVVADHQGLALGQLLDAVHLGSEVLAEQLDCGNSELDEFAILALHRVGVQPGTEDAGECLELLSHIHSPGGPAAIVRCGATPWESGLMCLRAVTGRRVAGVALTTIQEERAVGRVAWS